MSMVNSSNFSITSTLKSNPIKGLLFNNFIKIKNEVVGEKYDLSLVIIGDKKMRTLNRTHRGIDKTTDILSFGLEGGKDKNTGGVGEIFINPYRARIKSKKFDRSFDNFLSFLFIHGLFHLKGFDHGSTMDAKEEKIRKIFSI